MAIRLTRTASMILLLFFFFLKCFVGESFQFRHFQKMPDPYKGNDKAAYAVSYYASDRMINDSVHRLHQQAMQERRQELERLDREVYPDVHSSVRTPEEMKKYLEIRVTKEMLRRQQRKAALERDLYPERFSNGPHLNEERLQEQVLRLYKPDLTTAKRIEYHPRGEKAGSTKNVRSQSGPPGATGTTEQEQSRPVWRPSFGAEKKDYRAFLDQLYAPPPRPKSQWNEKRHEERILTLSKPLHVTEKKYIENSNSNDGRPAFKVSRRVEINPESGALY